MIHPILHSQSTHSMTQNSERWTNTANQQPVFFKKKVVNMVNDLFNSQDFNPWWICFQRQRHQRLPRSIKSG